jgi:hypothetical protein
MSCCQERINQVTVWIGNELKGGNYEGAVKVGTVEYMAGKSPYIFSGIEKVATSVQIRGGISVLSLAEVEVYG